jgi:predicted dehydrogenase
MADVRVGIVGAGFMGETHAEALRRTRGARLVAVAEPDAARREELARAHGVERTHGAAAELFADGGVDLVVIAAPNALHAPLAEEALRAGKHTLVEKPLALTLAETRRLKAAARESGRRLAFGENLVFAPKLVRLRELARDAEALGTVYHQRHVFQTCGPEGGWWLDPAAVGGGALVDLGCHAVETCRWLAGRPEARAVTARVRTVDAARFGPLDDFAVLWIEYADGSTAQCEVSWLRPGGEEVTAEVFGTRGLLRADLWKGMGLSAFTETRFASVWEPSSGWVHPEWDWIWNSGYPGSTQNVVDAILEGTDVEETVDEWEAVLEILLAAYLSAAEDRRVELPLDAPPEALPLELWRAPSAEDR